MYIQRRKKKRKGYTFLFQIRICGCGIGYGWFGVWRFEIWFRILVLIMITWYCNWDLLELVTEQRLVILFLLVVCDWLYLVLYVLEWMCCVTDMVCGWLWCVFLMQVVDLWIVGNFVLVLPVLFFFAGSDSKLVDEQVFLIVLKSVPFTACASSLLIKIFLFLRQKLILIKLD